MATCNEVIADALKLARVIPSGSVPTSDDYADGLVALQSMFDAWRTGGMFGELEDVYLEEDDTAEEGKRYFVTTGVTLTAPTSVYIDGDGIERQPRDLALYEALTEAGTQTSKVYDRTAWVDVVGLTGAGTCPLGARDRHGLAACLVTFGGLGDMFGAEVGQGVVSKAKKFLRNIMGKHGSTQDKAAGVYF